MFLLLVCFGALITTPRVDGLFIATSSASQFQREVTDWLRNSDLEVRDVGADLSPTPLPLSLSARHTELVVGEREREPRLLLQLLSTPTSPHEATTLSAAADPSSTRAGSSSPNLRVVSLFEDQWRDRRSSTIVRSRVLACVGRSARIMARKTAVRRIDASTHEQFLLENHLWGPVAARFRFGLFTKASPSDLADGDGDGNGDGGDLVAVASFSARRNVLRAGMGYRSHELVRYCSRQGTSVVGGISKLISAFRREVAPDDIVTVVDRDWGEGDGWLTLGFERVQQMPPTVMLIAPDGVTRCHLMGSGRNPHRASVPESLVEEYRQQRPVGGMGPWLMERGYFPVRDRGMQRLCLLFKRPHEGEEGEGGSVEDGGSGNSGGLLSTAEIWARSKPCYPERYYPSREEFAGIV